MASGPSNVPQIGAKFLSGGSHATYQLFIRKLKHSGKPSGDKYNHGRALYLLVKELNKYWRMNCRYEGRHKTLACGVYPEVSLAEARELCADARKQLRAGVDPKPSKLDPRELREDPDQNTFEALALQWLAKMALSRCAATQEKVQAWLEHDLFPFMVRLRNAGFRPSKTRCHSSLMIGSSSPTTSFPS